MRCGGNANAPLNPVSRTAFVSISLWGPRIERRTRASRLELTLPTITKALLFVCGVRIGTRTASRSCGARSARQGGGQTTDPSRPDHSDGFRSPRFLCRWQRIDRCLPPSPWEGCRDRRSHCRDGQTLLCCSGVSAYRSRRQYTTHYPLSIIL